MAGRTKQARQGLGARLREIRKDARFSGREFATLAGRHPPKITRLGRGARIGVPPGVARPYPCG